MNLYHCCFDACPGLKSTALKYELKLFAGLQQCSETPNETARAMVMTAFRVLADLYGEDKAAEIFRAISDERRNC